MMLTLEMVVAEWWVKNQHFDTTLIAQIILTKQNKQSKYTLNLSYKIKILEILYFILRVHLFFKY